MQQENLFRREREVAMEDIYEETERVDRRAVELGQRLEKTVWQNLTNVYFQTYARIITVTQ